MSALTPRRQKSLRKAELIRGKNSFDFSLRKSKSISYNYLKVFFFRNDVHQSDKDISADLNKTKVGFIVSKKKLKKAYLRTKAKRLLRETYRISKQSLFNILNGYHASLIFTYTDDGYVLFNIKPFPKRQILDDDFKHILIELKKQF